MYSITTPPPFEPLYSLLKSTPQDAILRFLPSFSDAVGEWVILALSVVVALLAVVIIMLMFGAGPRNK